MRWLTCILGVVFLLAILGRSSYADEYRLSRGDIIRGTPVSYDEEGVAFRLDIGQFSPRISWIKFDQATLKKLSRESREAAKYAEIFIIVPPEVKAAERAKKRQIPIREVSRAALPTEDERGGAAWISTPAGLLILGVLFLANLYAAFEVSVFRSRPAALVCAVSAIVPVVGPIFFLAMPERKEGVLDGDLAPGAELPSSEAAVLSSPLAPGGAVPQTGLSLAAAGKSAAGGPQLPAIYKRGETSFNRRFFETKFPGFFRVMPSEAEKDLVLSVKTPKGENVGRRISRISMNEMHLQLLRGNEVSISFGEITEVQLRHKDTKG